MKFFLWQALALPFLSARCLSLPPTALHPGMSSVVLPGVHPCCFSPRTIAHDSIRTGAIELAGIISTVDSWAATVNICVYGRGSGLVSGARPWPARAQPSS